MTALLDLLLLWAAIVAFVSVVLLLVAAYLIGPESDEQHVDEPEQD